MGTTAMTPLKKGALKLQPFPIQANDFVLRQEVRTLQHMNDSKGRELENLRKELRQHQAYLKDLYELWKEVRPL